MTLSMFFNSNMMGLIGKGVSVVVILLSIIACDPHPHTTERKYTDGNIAFTNLNSQAQSAIQLVKHNPHSITTLEKTVNLLLNQTLFFSNYSRFDEIDEMLRVYLKSNPNDARGLMLQAKFFSVIHRFNDSLAVIDQAEKKGIEPIKASLLRATIYQAMGKQTEHTHQLHLEALKKSKNFDTLTNVAASLAMRGNYKQADQYYKEAIVSYSDVSPLPIAWVHFQLGMMWSEIAGKPKKALKHYQTAVKLVPKYVVANIHLAELETDQQVAFNRLLALLPYTDEPELPAILSELATEEHLQMKYRLQAERSYMHWIKLYPAAFWNHATEFYLGVGNNRKIAKEFALKNWSNRQTPQAFELLVRSQNASLN